MANIELNKAIDADTEYFDSYPYHNVFSCAVAKPSSARFQISLRAENEAF